MRREFELTREDFEMIVRASQPVPYMVFGGYAPSSPQERIAHAWKQVGDKYGFQYMTVRPVPGKGDLYFTAELKEE